MSKLFGKLDMDESELQLIEDTMAENGIFDISEPETEECNWRGFLAFMRTSRREHGKPRLIFSTNNSQNNAEPNYKPRSRRQYKGFENICPAAEAGLCVLAKNDPDKFYDFCSTLNYDSCEELDEFVTPGAADLEGKNKHSLLLNPSIKNNPSKMFELRPLEELAALRMIDDPDLREVIDLTLRNVYQTDDSKERRAQAGKILGYSSLRISLHELFF